MPIIIGTLVIPSSFIYAQNIVNSEFNNAAPTNNLSNIEFEDEENLADESANSSANEVNSNDEISAENNAKAVNDGEEDLFGSDETALGNNPLNNLSESNKEENYNLLGEENLFEPTNSGQPANSPNSPPSELQPDNQSVQNNTLPAEANASSPPLEELYEAPLPGPESLNENFAEEVMNTGNSVVAPGEEGTLPENAFKDAQNSNSKPENFFQLPQQGFGFDPIETASPEPLSEPGSFTDPLSDIAGQSIESGVTEPDPLLMNTPTTVEADPISESKGLDGLTDSERELLKLRVQELRPLPRGAHPEEYIIQPGDTLWDISDQLLNDPYWWPKLWSFNPSIANPHLIEPGMRIIFEPSDGALPPSLALSDEGSFLSASVLETTFKAERNPSVDTWKDVEGTFIPPGEIADFGQIEIVEGRGVNAKSFVILPGEILRDDPQSLSKVSNLPSQRLTLLRGQTVYTEPSSTFRPQPGDRFLAARPHSGLTDDTRGIPFSADLWLYTGVLASVKTEASGRTRLTVEDSLHGVLPGDVIIPYREIFVEARLSRDKNQRAARADAQVAAISDGNKMFASYLDVVHLIDLPGTANPLSSLKAGDSLEILSPPSGAFSFDDDVEFIPAGKVEILSVRDGTAVALVTRVDHEILVGSRTGLSYLE